jgi:uncharacterized protein
MLRRGLIMVWTCCFRIWQVLWSSGSNRSALLGSVGPLTAPFFLALGLARGAYIAPKPPAGL